MMCIPERQNLSSITFLGLDAVKILLFCKKLDHVDNQVKNNCVYWRDVHHLFLFLLKLFFFFGGRSSGIQLHRSENLFSLVTRIKLSTKCGRPRRTKKNQLKSNQLLRFLEGATDWFWVPGIITDNLEVVCSLPSKGVGKFTWAPSPPHLRPAARSGKKAIHSELPGTCFGRQIFGEREPS